MQTHRCCVATLLLSGIVPLASPAAAKDRVLWMYARTDGFRIHRFDVSPDGRLLAATLCSFPRPAQIKHELRIWDLENDTLVLRQLVRQKGISASLVFSPDSKILALEDYPRLVRLLRVDRATRGRGRLSISLTPLAVLDQNVPGEGVAKIQHVTPRKTTTTLIDRRTGAIFSVDENRFEHPAGKKYNIPFGTAGCWQMRFSPDGKTLAVASSLSSSGGSPRADEIDERVLKLWDVSAVAGGGGTAELRHTIPLAGWSVLSISMEFSADGRRLVTRCPRDRDGKRSVEVRDVETAELISSFDPRAEPNDASRPVYRRHGWIGVRFALSPDASMFVTYSSLGTPVIRSVANAREMTYLPLIHTSACGAAAFSPDGTLLATGRAHYKHDRFAGGELLLWDVRTGTLKARRLNEHSDGIAWTPRFLPDGYTLAVGSRDSLALWDVPEMIDAFTPTEAEKARTEYFPQPNPTEARIIEILQSESTVQLKDVPIGELHARLNKAIQQRVSLAKGALQLANIDPDRRVTLAPNGRPLGEALRELLAPLGLSASPTRDRLLIFAPEGPPQGGGRSRTFPVDDLCADEAAVNRLVEQIKQLDPSAVWRETENDAGRSLLVHPLVRTITVRQPYRFQAKVVRLLRQLREEAKQKAPQT